MKKVSFSPGYLFLLTTGILILIACSREIVSPPGPSDTGYLSINVGLNIEIEKSGRMEEVVLLDDYKVIIYNDADEIILEFERYADVPESIELPVGNYYVVAYSDNLLPAEWENPYYYGQSDNFTLDKAEVEAVDIVVTLHNVIVDIIYSSTVVSDFETYQTEVTGAGSLVYVETETRSGYFEVSPLFIQVDLSFSKSNGEIVNRTLSTNIPSPEKADYYKVTINTEVKNGEISPLNIIINGEVNEIEIILTDDNETTLPPTNSIFVSSNGDDSNIGDSNNPMLTIQAAINKAQTSSKDNVVVSTGTYTETLTLRSEVNVLGGYDASNWTRDIDANESIIMGGYTAIQASNIQNVTIEGLTIRSLDAVGFGNSSYAVFLENCTNVTLTSNKIFPGNGSAGQNGLSGSTGADGNPGQIGRPGCEDGGFTCDNCIRPQPGNGGGPSPNGGRGGFPGLGSDNGDNGLFGSSSPSRSGGFGGSGGNGPGGNGQPGGDGSTGLSGINGSGGNDFGIANSSGYIPSNGTNGLSGSAGSGGGGGGGGGGGTSFCDSYGSSGGGGGSGGHGGSGGTLGTGGGGSFGVWLFLCSSISIENNEITTRNGGNGGQGGIGGVGGQGGNGGAGGPYGGINDQDDAGNGAPGGDGGNGGNGGRGGGGGGGPSIGIISINTSETESSNNFSIGSGGAGGVLASNGEMSQTKSL